MTKKLFNVEYIKTVYIDYNVEADTEEEAQDLADAMLEGDGDLNCGENWEPHHVEDITKQKGDV